MKIVSLQSVGLGAIFSGGNGATGFNEPYILKVGKKLKDGRGYSLDVTVTEINHIKPYQSFEYYEVKTSDGHIRVLPAEKYIAEWSE
ncbi:hypothetical protein [Leuconostoc mesenteroides]|uniref:hypothetical protein n=1 Tax=Leuconostoc mesenteroides TaxID=1245 RepID=UPI0023601BC8|nr:hypothetical protein [Leuconostoc mesenteroides]